MSRIPLGLAFFALLRRPKSAHPRTFVEAVHSLEATLHVRSTPMVLQDGEPAAGVVGFRVSNGRSFVLDFHDRMLEGGAYLFIADHGFTEPTDLIGLAPTTDPFEVIRMVHTTGNGLHDNAEVIAWLRDLNRTQPFALLGMGLDFVEGAFLEPIHDPQALARNINTFCPDFVSQGLGLFEKGPPEALIADYFSRERQFYFWWD